MTTLSKAQLQAIIDLLHDRSDPEVQNMLNEQLQQLDTSSLEALRRQAAGASDQALMDVEAVLHQKQWDDLGVELASASQLNQSALLDLLLTIARFGHFECDAEQVRENFSQLADGCRALFSDTDSELERMNKVIGFLAGEKHFRGNADDYYNPENSFIDTVLRTRLGIPISLSALYLVVAEALDLPLRGVALPGHFIVGLFVLNQKACYFDPFHEGRQLSKLDCAQMVNEYGHSFEEHYLQPVTTRQIIQRMLNNLYAAYDSAGQEQRRQGIIRLIRALS